MKNPEGCVRGRLRTILNLDKCIFIHIWLSVQVVAGIDMSVWENLHFIGRTELTVIIAVHFLELGMSDPFKGIYFQKIIISKVFNYSLALVIINNLPPSGKGKVAA